MIFLQPSDMMDVALSLGSPKIHTIFIFSKKYLFAQVTLYLIGQFSRHMLENMPEFNETSSMNFTKD